MKGCVHIVTKFAQSAGPSLTDNFSNLHNARHKQVEAGYGLLRQQHNALFQERNHYRNMSALWEERLHRFCNDIDGCQGTGWREAMEIDGSHTGTARHGEKSAAQDLFILRSEAEACRKTIAM